MPPVVLLPVVVPVSVPVVVLLAPPVLLAVTELVSVPTLVLVVVTTVSIAVPMPPVPVTGPAAVVVVLPSVPLVLADVPVGAVLSPLSVPQATNKSAPKSAPPEPSQVCLIEETIRDLIMTRLDSLSIDT